MRKKRLFLLMVLLSVLSFVACGSNEKESLETEKGENVSTEAENKEEQFILSGTWRGKCDLLALVKTGMTGTADPYKDCLDEFDLSFDAIFTFEDDKVTIQIDEETANRFRENTKLGYREVCRYSLPDVLIQVVPGATSLEDALIYTSCDTVDEMLALFARREGFASYEEYLYDFADKVQFYKFIDPFYKILNVSGNYLYDEEAGILYIQQEEVWYKYECTLEEGVLTMKIPGDTMDFYVICEREN